MLGTIAGAVGGIIKDTQVALGNAWDVIVDEVSSVPESFELGYEHGLFTGPDLPEDEHHDHHVDTEKESIVSKHVDPEDLGTTVQHHMESRKFGNKS